VVRGGKGASWGLRREMMEVFLAGSWTGFMVVARRKTNGDVVCGWNEDWTLKYTIAELILHSDRHPT
jgi:hypothetical protein